MKSYYRQKSHVFPEISFNVDSGIFEITGSWLPYSGLEQELFVEILDWLDKYFETPCKKTTLNLNLPYYGTSTSRFLLKLLTKFDILFDKGNNVEVNWFYDPEDEDLEEAGIEYNDLIKNAMNLMPVNMD